MDVKQSWEAITGWLQANQPAMLALLGGPAGDEQLAGLESQIGQTLPEDFKASYRLHDGSEPNSGLFLGLNLMPLAEIGRVWQMWAEVAEDYDEDLDEECVSHPVGAVRLKYCNPAWIPVAGDSQNFIALDYDPGPQGKLSQVINTGRDDSIRHVIAGSYGEFLSFVAEQFAQGQVYVTDERWLALPPDGKRDLLTGLRSLLGVK